MGLSLPRRKGSSPYLIPRRARINDVLSLRRLVMDTRADLLTAKHHLDDLERLLREVRHTVMVSLTGLESIVAIYNRLVVEYEPEERK